MTRRLVRKWTHGGSGEVSTQMAQGTQNSLPQPGFMEPRSKDDRTNVVPTLERLPPLSQSLSETGDGARAQSDKHPPRVGGGGAPESIRLRIVEALR